MNDLDWMVDVVTNDIPKKNTAWVIRNIKTTQDAIDVQSFLFNHNFSWSGEQQIMKYREYDIKSLSSVFSDDIRENSITYSIYDDLENTIRLVRKHSSEKELYVFKWVNGTCQLNEVINL